MEMFGENISVKNTTTSLILFALFLREIQAP